MRTREYNPVERQFLKQMSRHPRYRRLRSDRLGRIMAAQRMAAEIIAATAGAGPECRVIAEDPSAAPPPHWGKTVIALVHQRRAEIGASTGPLTGEFPSADTPLGLVNEAWARVMLSLATDRPVAPAVIFTVLWDLLQQLKAQLRRPYV